MIVWIRETSRAARAARILVLLRAALCNNVVVIWSSDDNTSLQLGIFYSVVYFKPGCCTAWEMFEKSRNVWDDGKVHFKILPFAVDVACS